MISSQRAPHGFPLCGIQLICAKESTKRHQKFPVIGEHRHKEIRYRSHEKKISSDKMIFCRLNMLRVVFTTTCCFKLPLAIWFWLMWKTPVKSFPKIRGLWSCRELLWWSSTASDFYFTGEKVRNYDNNIVRVPKCFFFVFKRR